MKVFRVYVENSVVGGYFDKEFEVATKLLFDMFRKGLFKPVISTHVIKELDDGAPIRVIENLKTIDYEMAEVDDEVLSLAKSYIEEGAVSEQFYGDALHVAIATVSEVDVLVSWNCKHINNLHKIKLFNAINLKNGYKMLEIRNPEEVLKNE